MVNSSFIYSSFIHLLTIRILNVTRISPLTIINVDNILKKTETKTARGDLEFQMTYAIQINPHNMFRYVGHIT